MNTYPSLLMLITLLLSSACSVIPEQAPPPQQFDFGPLPESSVLYQPTYDIRLGSVTTATWMETNKIQYRLLYEQPFAYRTYAAHVWVAPPAELFALRINHQLFKEGDSGNTARLDLVLDSFEQVFEDTRTAYVEARLQATLFDEKGRTLSRREFHGRRPASADVRGAIETLPLLADELVTNLLEWIASLPGSPAETDNDLK